MKHLLNIVKGILVGMAIMIPGVSGGSMVMSMGLYPALLSLISGTRDERKGTLPVAPPSSSLFTTELQSRFSA